MFDLVVTFDKTGYVDGEQFQASVAAVDGRHIRVDDVRWTATDAAAFTIDGTTVTGAARASFGHLGVHASDNDGQDAATTAGVPMAARLGRFSQAD